jgi:hypothetical protein
VADNAGGNQARRLKKRGRLAEQQLKADYCALMATRAGRNVMWGLLEEAGLFLVSFAGDSHATAFNEGMRNAGLRLFGRLRAWCPEDYTLMATESLSAERIEAAERAAGQIEEKTDDDDSGA